MDSGKIGRISLYLLATSPNWVVAWTMFPAGWGRVPFVLLAVSVLIVAAAGSFHAQANDGRGQVPAFGALGSALGAYILVYVLASVFGVDAWRSFWGEQSRQDGLLMLLNFVAIAALSPVFLKSESHWRNLWRVAFWSAVLPASVALLEVAIPVVRAHYQEASRFSAWFTNPLFLGGYLAMATFFGIRLFGRTHGIERYVTLAGILVVAAGTFATGSRGPLLALVAGVAAAALVWIAAAGGRKARVALVSAFVASVLVVSAGAVLVSRGALPAPVVRVFATDRYIEENVPRLISWGIAWKAFLERPLLGWGPQNFRVPFDRLYDPTLLKYSFYETVSDKPHDLFLETLAVGGVPLALAFVALFVVAVATAVSSYRRGSDTALGMAASIGTIVAYLVHTAFLFDSPSTSLLLFLTFAWFMRDRSGAIAERVSKAFSAIPASFRKAAAMALGVLIVACDVYAGGFGFVASAATVKATDPAALADAAAWRESLDRALNLPNPYRDEMRQYVAFAFLRWYSDGKLTLDSQKAIAPVVRAAIEDSRSRQPYDFMTAFVLGQLYSVEGSATGSPETLTKAVDELRAAHDLSLARQAVPIQLAKVLLLGGKDAEAVDLLRGLVAEDESVSEPHWFLGLALAASGDKREAAKEISRSLELGRSPKSQREVLYMIDLFAKSEMYADIVPLYKLLISQEPGNADWHARLAATYAAMGNPAAAVAEAQAAADLDPDFEEEADSFMRNLDLTR